MVIWVLLALAIAIVAVIFAVQNITAVTITFFAWQISGSLSLVLLLAMGIGVLIGVLVMMPSSIRNRMAAASLRKQKTKLEKKLDELQKRLDELTQPEASVDAASSATSLPAPTPNSQPLNDAVAAADRSADTPEMK